MGPMAITVSNFLWPDDAKPTILRNDKSNIFNSETCQLFDDPKSGTRFSYSMITQKDIATSCGDKKVFYGDLSGYAIVGYLNETTTQSSSIITTREIESPAIPTTPEEMIEASKKPKDPDPFKGKGGLCIWASHQIENFREKMDDNLEPGSGEEIFIGTGGTWNGPGEDVPVLLYNSNRDSLNNEQRIGNILFDGANNMKAKSGLVFNGGNAFAFSQATPAIGKVGNNSIQYYYANLMEGQFDISKIINDLSGLMPNNGVGTNEDIFKDKLSVTQLKSKTNASFGGVELVYGTLKEGTRKLEEVGWSLSKEQPRSDETYFSLTKDGKNINIVQKSDTHTSPLLPDLKYFEENEYYDLQGYTQSYTCEDYRLADQTLKLSLHNSDGTEGDSYNLPMYSCSKFAFTYPDSQQKETS